MRFGAAALLLLCAVGWFAGQRTNPPGFHVDESSIAYNALTMAQSGVDEHGVPHPLFFRAFGETKNPVYIYLLAAVFRVVHPSPLAARRLSALLALLAAVVLGWLAWRITRSDGAAAITFVTALATPMLFEISRLAFEVAAYPLVLALLLVAVHAAFQRPRWDTALVAALAGAFVLLTYTYSIGRLHAPLLLLAFAILAWTKERRAAIAAIVLLYVALAVVPMIAHRRPLTRRFQTIAAPAAEVPANFVEDLVPVGDPNPRHHVPGSGPAILLMTIALAVAGAATALRRRQRWWWFVAAGALTSVLPAALTYNRHHALRLVAWPIFLIVLSIAALERRRAFVVALLAIGVVQAAFFFTVFARTGAERLDDFDAGFPEVLREASARDPGTLYVRGPDYIHAWWFGALAGIPRERLVQLWVPPAPGAIIIAKRQPCPACVPVVQHGVYAAWQNR